MAITSETQRRYDPKKGGYSYYTLFHADKGEKPEWAQDGDVIEEFGDGGKVYVCSRDAKGRIKWTEDADWDRQTGGSGSSEGGGGGAEKFIVTLTQENDTWTADKTIAEIVAAYNDGKIVFAKYPFHGVLCDVPCLVSGVVDKGDTGTSMAAFIGVLSIDSDDTRFANIVGYRDAETESDFWHVNEVIQNVLPSGENEGDLLVWDSDHDQWKAESNPNAPLIVTLTAGATEGQFVGDKTYKEVYDAFISGKTCLFNITISDSSAAESFVLIGATFGEGEYNLHSGDVSAHGVANDYVTLDFGG